jgi:hypothetical protein
VRSSGRWAHYHGTISRYLANRILNLIQQRRDPRRIVRILIRQRLCHNHAAGGVNRQIKLSPFPARLRRADRRSLEASAGEPIFVDFDRFAGGRKMAWREGESRPTRRRSGRTFRRAAVTKA